MTRRAALATAAAGALPAQNAVSAWQPPAEMVEAHDKAIDTRLQAQILTKGHRFYGGFADADGLVHGGATGGALHTFGLGYILPRSRHHKSPLMLERMKLVCGYLDAHTSPEGNIDLLITNFNSPPDTAFMIWGVGQIGALARRLGVSEVEKIVEPVLRRSGRALATGGIHTPNHRWVASSALAQIHELYPDTSYVKRIGEWLAEGIDIDSDGQYTERSTGGYNGITNRAFTILAAKLNRPELLEPVRRNLDAMLYLLHPGEEVVTDISRRQDLYTAGTMAGYSLSLKYMAVRDGNGVYETLSRRFPPSLGDTMEYAELQQPGPAPKPVPADYVKEMPFIQVGRVRRGERSATVMLDGRSRFFGIRNGKAVIEAVRLGSLFFGKAQFQPQRCWRARDVDGRPQWVLEESMEAPYYQPLHPAESVGTEEWGAKRRLRAKTQMNYLSYRATVTETAKGFTLRFDVEGPKDLPVMIEVALRPGGQLSGVEPHPREHGCHLLKSGFATYSAGGGVVRFGPGMAEHQAVAGRGIEPRLPGPTVFLTGFAPLSHTLEIEA
ncbi:MAG: hypothetical protein IT164_05615 [Bryobacterales bacterium]|nr:hypothetical protein [Bryobacterales bacterium]